MLLGTASAAIADTGNVFDPPNLGSAVCGAGPGPRFPEDLDGDGSDETFVVVLGVSGETAVFHEVSIPNGIDRWVLTASAASCTGDGTARLKIRFVDMTAPGFDPDVEASWTYKSVPALRISGTGSGPPVVSPTPFNLYAYRDLNQADRLTPIHGTLTGVGDKVFSDPAGVAEVTLHTGWSENRLYPLFLMATAPTTPVGSNVEVTLPSGSVTWSQVTIPGNTFLESSDQGELPPAGSAPCTPDLATPYYEVSTNAEASGVTRLCVHYPSRCDDASIGMWSYSTICGGFPTICVSSWQDVTVSVDAEADVVCADQPFLGTTGPRSVLLLHDLVDEDGDGYTNDVDCDDGDDSIHPDAVEACNGSDDDCDPSTPDGWGESSYGAPCDGLDSDACAEGTTICQGVFRPLPFPHWLYQLTCLELLENDLDLCNGLDDDCDPETLDGAHESWLGAPCDGPDAGACLEGVLSCSGGAMACSDLTDDDLDLCNGSDDDCDPGTPDGFAESGFGKACDGADRDLCKEGSVVCVDTNPTGRPVFALVCSDDTPSNAEICNGIDDDCDGLRDEGFSDRDGDTVADCVDACADDPSKVEPGICGCGVSDAQDSDGDAVPDCIDLCEGDDASGDGDGDGWCSSEDVCPTVYNPDQADEDRDGTGDQCDWDLRIYDVEITQATQDAANSVPLVVGKNTWVRASVDVGAAGQSLEGVTGRLTFVRADGSPYPVHADRVVKPMPEFVDVTAAHADDRADASNTLNFFVPKAWFFPPLSGAHVRIEVMGTDPVTPDPDSSNNTAGPIPLEFHYTLPLNVNLLTFDTPFAGCSVPTVGDFLVTARWLQRIFPTSTLNVWHEGSGATQMDPTDSGFNAFLLWFDIFMKGQLNIGSPPRVRFFGLVCRENPPPLHRNLSGFGLGEAAWSINDPRAVAHEMGHAFALEHPNDGCLEPWPYEENYPVYPAWLDEYGADPDGFAGTGSSRTVKVYPPYAYWDFMSYCVPGNQPPGNSGLGRWVSKYMYQQLYDSAFSLVPPAAVSGAALGAGPAAAADAEYLVVLGTVDPEDRVELEPLRVVRDAAGQHEERGSGDYSIELFDATGVSLFIRDFDPSEVGDETGLAVFAERIPQQPEMAAIVLAHRGEGLEKLDVSANRPRVTLLQPNGGEELRGETSVRWSASDEDADPLVFDLQYSRDGGASWSTLAVGLTEEAWIWDTGAGPGTRAGLLRVLASDGASGAQDDSDATFSVASGTPLADIESPEDGARYYLGQLVVLEGSGWDREDGMLRDESLRWASDVDGPLGAGDQLALSDLAPGPREITLTATDSDGNASSDRVAISVDADRDGDGDGVGDRSDNCPRVSNPSQTDTDRDGVGDACDDDDWDSDGFPDRRDNCPDVANDQADADSDGVGDACECGDFNRDGRVTTVDARLIQRCVVGQIACGGLCDVTGDGVCSTIDARLIQRLVVQQLGKDDLRCAERP